MSTNKLYNEIFPNFTIQLIPEIPIENIQQGLYLMTLSKGNEIKYCDKIFVSK